MKGATMSKSATINARIDPAIKERAGHILRTLGLRHSDAVSMFYHQLVRYNGLPFETRIPTDETLEAVSEDVSTNKRYSNSDDMAKDLLK